LKLKITKESCQAKKNNNGDIMMKLSKNHKSPNLTFKKRKGITKIINTMKKRIRNISIRSIMLILLMKKVC
jgi:hypothetical protein